LKSELWGREALEKSELKAKIYSKIEELPTLPAMIPKLLQLNESTKSSVSDLTALIARDPALSSKILKVANSGYYGFSQKISELERAIALLGFNMVKSLALSIGVIRSMPTRRRGTALRMRLTLRIVFSWELASRDSAKCAPMHRVHMMTFIHSSAPRISSSVQLPSGSQP
jgi:c-di-GMP-related signal transduction protein